MAMKKIFSLVILFVSVLVHASPVSENKAREIAGKFFYDAATKTAVPGMELVWAGKAFPSGIHDMSSSNNPEEAYVYVYNRKTADGFVVVSGETGTVPVIAFSRDRNFDMEDMSPGTRALMQGWCRQIKAARESNHASVASKDSEENVEGRVVIKHDTPLWGQTVPYNLEAPVFDGEQCVTGCVATAMSIVAYCNRYPVSGTGTIPEYTYGGVTIPSQELGRAYDYDNMLMDYSGGYSEEQGKAVAALMKDMGVAVKMEYGVGESGAYDYLVMPALTEHFGYSKNTLLVNAESYDGAEWNAILMENIDKYGPTYYRGQGMSGGHAFVLDGYTEKGYFSINYGWNGSNNGYYMLPDSEFYDEQKALLYLEPDPQGSSSYRDLLAVVALQYSETNETYWGLQAMSDSYKTGIPCLLKVAGVVNMSQVPFNGMLKIVLCDKDGNVKENLCEWELNGLAYQELQEYKQPFELLISSGISVGDRFRLYCKGEYSEDWQFVRGYDSDAVHEVVISSSPDYIAGPMWLMWDKESKALNIESALPMQCSIEGNGFSASASSRPYVQMTLDLKDFPPGEYLLKLSSGSDPYEVVIVL